MSELNPAITIPKIIANQFKKNEQVRVIIKVKE